jgi:hypothetical protein
MPSLIVDENQEVNIPVTIKNTSDKIGSLQISYDV